MSGLLKYDSCCEADKLITVQPIISTIENSAGYRS
jgi:hypothetical protein